MWAASTIIPYLLFFGMCNFSSATPIGQKVFVTDTVALDQFIFGSKRKTTPSEDPHLYCVVKSVVSGQDSHHFARLDIATLTWELVKSSDDFADATNIELITHDGPNFLISRSDNRVITVNSDGEPTHLGTGPQDVTGAESGTWPLDAAFMFDHNGNEDSRNGWILQSDGTVHFMHKSSGSHHHWEVKSQWNHAPFSNANGISSVAGDGGVYIIATNNGLEFFNGDGHSVDPPTDYVLPTGYTSNLRDTFGHTDSTTGKDLIVVATSDTALISGSEYATALLNDGTNGEGFVQAILQPIVSPTPEEAKALRAAPLRVPTTNDGVQTYLMISGVEEGAGFIPLRPITARR